jgi:hypothetical protein
MRGLWSMRGGSCWFCVHVVSKGVRKEGAERRGGGSTLTRADTSKTRDERVR